MNKVLQERGYIKPLPPAVLAEVLKHEGALVDNPRDPGGLTNWGISLRAYPWLGRDGVTALTQEQAGRIYRRDYWDALRAAEMPFYLALAVFDSGVNQGITWTRRALQRAAQVRPDGVIGPKTLAACQGPGVLGRFLQERQERYMSLSTWDVFGKGWSRRLLNITVVAYDLKDDLKDAQKDKEEA